MMRQYFIPAPKDPLDKRRYDNALRTVYRKYRSWPDVRAAVELYLPVVCANTMEVPETSFHKYFLDRRPPLAYAMALVLAMEGKVSLFDFYPYLEKFLTETQSTQQGAPHAI